METENNDKFIVKSNRIWEVLGISYALTVPLFFVPFTENLSLGRTIGCFITILFVPLVIFLLHLSWGKKYTFSKEGCTVQFGLYKKHYDWGELKTKQIITVRRASFVDKNAVSLFVFSKHKFRTFKLMKYMRPHEYGAYIHPLSFIYLNTVPEEITDEKLKKGFAIYPVREAEFREKLKSWGVELEEKQA